MNPEFTRNLWLETTPRRIAWAAVAVAAILFASAALFGHAGPGGMGRRGPVEAIGAAGLLIFVVAGLIWGGREAGRAVRIEIGERTWDFQRLSALTPWRMTWGKLFGATSLAWLTALAGLIAAVPAIWTRLPPDQAVQFVVGALALALLIQAGSLAASLVAVRKARAEGRLATLRGGIGGFFSVIVVLWVISRGLSLAFVIARGGDTAFNGWLRLDPRLWWGVGMSWPTMLTASLVAYAAWAVVASWRLMRLELQMRAIPWAWTTFLVFAALHLAGFAGSAARPFALMAGVFAAGAYAAAFVDPADPVRLRQFAAAARGGDVREAAIHMPLALPAVALAFLAVVAFAASPTAPFSGASPAFGFAAFAFLARDLGVIFFFRFGPRPHRGDLGAVLALLVLYMVGGAVGLIGGETAGALFHPDPLAPLVGLGSASAQAAVVWMLAIRRIGGSRPLLKA